MKRQTGKQMVALCLVLMLALVCAVPAAAVEDTPQQVLDAKNGVVRIISETRDGVYTGTGFAVGSGERVYVVTNVHVVEDSIGLYVFYDNGKYVKASVYRKDEARDLCILKLDKTISGLQTLRLETDGVPSGIAVYALGYPAAADYFTMDPDETYETVEQVLKVVVANKDSMTITNGIISAIHDSTLIGDMSTRVKTLQTNTAINGGNSGGPLLNREGRVVGINTMGITVADAMNGCVHVEELIALLGEAKIRFEGTPEPVALSSSDASLSQSQEQPASTGPMVWIVLFFVAVLAGGALALALVLKKKKKSKIKGGMTLDAFERSHRKVEEVAAFDMVRRFLSDELLPLSQYDLNSLFTMENVVIGDDVITLADTEGRLPPGAMPPVVPGYSAPEWYQGMPGQAATVYFVGAVLYTMLTGRRPPEAPGRLLHNAPAFPVAGTLQSVVNQAMEPYEQNRIPTLPVLWDVMAQAADAVYAENGYGPPTHY